MSRTVCGWCKAPLVLKDDILVCGNTDCPACDEKYLHEELILTRKALDVLLLTINRLENQNYKDCVWHLRLAIAKIKAIGIANNALEQITALEQKDV